MGTEKDSNHHQFVLPLNYVVKLNNPLMGTENLSISIIGISEMSLIVKLNNPLMGTENSKELWI